MTYSLDFRQKVLSVHERDHLTFQQVADRFSVGIASVERWSKNPAIKAYVRVKTRKIDLDLLALGVEICSDTYQDERAERVPKNHWASLKKAECHRCLVGNTPAHNQHVCQKYQQ